MHSIFLGTLLNVSIFAMIKCSVVNTRCLAPNSGFVRTPRGEFHTLQNGKVCVKCWNIVQDILCIFYWKPRCCSVRTHPKLPLQATRHYWCNKCLNHFATSSVLSLHGPPINPVA